MKYILIACLMFFSGTFATLLAEDPAGALHQPSPSKPQVAATQLTQTDLLTISAALGATTLQLIPLSLTLLLGLFEVRREKLFIRKATTRRIQLLHVLFTVGVVLWLAVCVLSFTEWLPAQLTRGITVVSLGVQALLTLCSLLLLIRAVKDLFEYFHSTQRNP